MDYDKFGIVITIIIVIVFNVFLLNFPIDEIEETEIFLELDCENLVCSCCEDESSPLLKIYDYVEVPLSAIVGYAIAWFFYQRRNKEKKAKQKEILDNVLDNMTFLYIGVKGMLNEKPIKESSFDSLKSTQDLILDTLRNSSHTLNQQDINNLTWIVKGEDIKTMFRFKPELRTYGPTYSYWLEKIEKTLRKHRGKKWDEDILKTENIINDVTSKLVDFDKNQTKDK